MEYVDMRAMIHGYDPVLMESVGYMAFYNLNEDARKDARNLLKGQSIKEAKDYMKSAKRRIKEGNYKEAVSNYDSAIAILKDLRRKAENIDDDNLIQTFFVGAMKGLLFAIAETVLAVMLTPAAAGAVAGVSTATAKKSMTGDMVFSAFTCASVVYGIIGGTIQIGALFSKKKETSEKNKSELKSDQAWYKIGISRASTMSAFDRMIEVCEKCRDEIKGHK